MSELDFEKSASLNEKLNRCIDPQWNEMGDSLSGDHVSKEMNFDFSRDFGDDQSDASGDEMTDNFSDGFDSFFGGGSSDDFGGDLSGDFHNDFGGRFDGEMSRESGNTRDDFSGDLNNDFHSDFDNDLNDNRDDALSDDFSDDFHGQFSDKFSNPSNQNFSTAFNDTVPNQGDDAAMTHAGHKREAPSSAGPVLRLLLLVVLIAVGLGILIAVSREHSKKNDDITANAGGTESQIQEAAVTDVSSENTESSLTEAETSSEAEPSSEAETSSVAEASSEAETSSEESSPESKYRELAQGEQSEDVMKMQKRLCKLGYINEKSCTGYYGPYTSKKIKEFQKAAGLEETGTADAKTLARLYASDAPKA